MLLKFRTRQLSGFALVVVLMGLSTTWAGYTFLKKTVLKEAQLRVEMDLNSAWVAYREALTRLVYAVSSASQEEFSYQLDIAQLNSDSLSHRLARLREKNGFDFLTLVDVNGKVIAKSRFHRADGEIYRADAIIEGALAGEPSYGTILASESELHIEDDALVSQASILLVTTEMAIPTERTVENRGLVMEAAVPLFNSQGKVQAVLYGGILLNRRYGLVDGIRHAVFGELTYEGKPIGTVTIFLDDVRVATNVMQLDQTRALGTRVSEIVYHRVIGEGKRFVDRAFVVNDWYLSAYDPLKDPSGKVIGIVYVGLLEKKYLAYGSSLAGQFLIISFGTMLLAVLVALYLTNTFRRPLQQLVEATRKLASGNLSARVHVRGASRETAELATAFNAMAENLEQRNNEVQQTSERLRWAYERVDEKNRAYLETLGFVTHELKSPLASIVFAVGALREKILGPLTTQQDAVLKSAANSADYLKTTIGNYLNLSRVEEGQLKLQLRETDVGKEIIPAVVDRVTEMAAENKMKILNTVAGKFLAECDPDLITSVFQNLLTNAIIYGRFDGRVEIRGEANDNHLTFHIWNEGMGFNAEMGKRLFERFFRISNRGKDTKAGTGIGLFISRRIIESHDGKIWADSAEGQWAKFSFTLPVRFDKQKINQAESQP